jgi:hypothetical protein
MAVFFPFLYTTIPAGNWIRRTTILNEHDQPTVGSSRATERLFAADLLLFGGTVFASPFT